MLFYEKLTYTLDTSGQNRDYTCISESGLYSLVLTSRKLQAEPFQDMVAQEVLISFSYVYYKI
ncbi:MAG: Bro-N domain-containing protein [Flavobacterium sp.]